MAPHQCYNEKTFNETILFEDLLYNVLLGPEDTLGIRDSVCP